MVKRSEYFGEFRAISGELAGFLIGAWALLPILHEAERRGLLAQQPLYHRADICDRSSATNKGSMRIQCKSEV